MESTIKCGKHLAEHADISGSRFVDVNLAAADFNDVNLGGVTLNNVNLSGARLSDINLSDVTIQRAQIGGVKLCSIGPPPDKDGKSLKQRPVTFENGTLCDSTFRNVDLSNVRISGCNTEGMTIDGVGVRDLLATYRKSKGM
jgi:uncharacterized protein YjbI with pentapeptide repeats